MLKSERRSIRVIVDICRIIVGLLFIFSGLVKANDPSGLSYKMQEFFDVWSQNPSLTWLMHELDNFALSFSIIMITLEIGVGIALLVGWNKKFTIWLLLLLIVFFTFLTGYAVFSGKIKTCGCFGDCIPLTAVQSFIKDLILCVLIIVLITFSRFITPSISRINTAFILVFSIVAVLSFQWYVLRHMPIIDCLPFKKGNNILALRKMPSNAIPDKMDFIFIYQKNGKQKEFSKDKLPDSTWSFVKRQDIIIQNGSNNEPPVKDFYLNTSGGSDTTDAVLSNPGYYYLLFVKTINENRDLWYPSFEKIYGYAKTENRNIIVVASQVAEADEYFNNTKHMDLKILSLDATALKTASRTDPSLYLMHGPVVINKWGWADFSNVLK